MIMLELCVYLSRQGEGAWGGQVTDRGMVALPSPETGLGSDWSPCRPRSQVMRMEQNCQVCPCPCKAPVLYYWRKRRRPQSKLCSPIKYHIMVTWLINANKSYDATQLFIGYLSSSWLLWGGVGSEAGTSTVLGPCAMARASRSSSVLNGTCSGFGTSPLDTVENRSTMSIWMYILCLHVTMKILHIEFL